MTRTLAQQAAEWIEGDPDPATREELADIIERSIKVVLRIALSH